MQQIFTALFAIQGEIKNLKWFGFVSTEKITPDTASFTDKLKLFNIFILKPRVNCFKYISNICNRI